MTNTPLVSNVLSVYNTASADNVRAGLSWYLTAHNLAALLSPGNPAMGAGVIAALSPMMGWDSNVMQAKRAFERGNANGLGLAKNCAKADAILAGAEPLSVLGGNKVRAFYSTILDPTGFSVPVIDRHAFDIAVGEVTDDKRRSTLSRKGVYDAFGAVYVEAARIVGIGAPQMQAVTWMEWRERKP